MNIREMLQLIVEEQSRIAPNSEPDTKKNHYVSQFYQKGWAIDGKVNVIYKDKGRISKGVAVDNIMFGKYLYTIKEHPYPNLYEKLRTRIESPLVDPIANLIKNDYQLDDRVISELLALFLCSSPVMIDQYEEHVRVYIKSASPSVELKDWEVKSLACARMIYEIEQVASRILSDYDFETVRVEERLILSDHPIIQIVNGDMIHSQVGYYAKSDQMIFPLNPHAYVLATRKSTNAKKLRGIEAWLVNDFMLRNADNMIVDCDEDSLISTAKYKIGSNGHINVPAEIQYTISGFGLLHQIVELSDGSVDIVPIYGNAVTWPKIYDDDIIVVDEGSPCCFDPYCIRPWSHRM